MILKKCTWENSNAKSKEIKWTLDAPKRSQGKKNSKIFTRFIKIVFCSLPLAPQYHHRKSLAFKIFSSQKIMSAQLFASVNKMGASSTKWGQKILCAFDELQLLITTYSTYFCKKSQISPKHMWNLSTENYKTLLTFR